MNREGSQTSAYRIQTWQPLIAIIAAGVTVTFVLMLVNPHLPRLPQRLAYLISGFLLTAFLTILSAFLLLFRQYSNEYQNISRNFQKELAERQTASEMRQQLEKTMLQGQKLQAIGTLAGGIAHDFNNILYAIIGYIEMAIEDSPHDTPLYANLGKVLAAAKRGQDLVSGILAFSRSQHAELSPLSLRKTIEDVLGLLIPTIPAGVIIHFDRENPDCIVLGNQTSLHQVFINLINNAVDAMEGEGKITIRLERFSPDRSSPQEISSTKSLSGTRTVTLAENRHFCKITLSDTGYGMDAVTLERIFEPFFTTKEVGRGTGLGLSTVHAIIRNHKGKIIAASQPGAGSTFTIFLPEYNNDSHPGNFPEGASSYLV
jgi:signal transduction histidine kinase